MACDPCFAPKSDPTMQFWQLELSQQGGSTEEINIYFTCYDFDIEHPYCQGKNNILGAHSEKRSLWQQC
jgi:hypothetical protein